VIVCFVDNGKIVFLPSFSKRFYKNDIHVNMSTCYKCHMMTMSPRCWYPHDVLPKQTDNTMSISRWDRLSTMSSTMSNLINRFNPTVKCSYLSHGWTWNSLAKRRDRFWVYWCEARDSYSCFILL